MKAMLESMCITQITRRYFDGSFRRFVYAAQLKGGQLTNGFPTRESLCHYLFFTYGSEWKLFVEQDDGTNRGASE